MKESNGYGIHPSKELVALFREKPFQGQHPELARIIFFGTDANYSESISNDPFFARIIEYHADGVAFWKNKKYNKHHPFLLKGFPLPKNTGGVPYHRNFAALGFTPNCAGCISFVEILDVPTTGNSSGQEEKFWELFNPGHAKWLDVIIGGGSKRLVFISDSVIRRMRIIKKRWGLFDWIPYGNAHGLLCRIEETAVHKVFHFSDGRIYGQIPDIQRLIKALCNETCELSRMP